MLTFPWQKPHHNESSQRGEGDKRYICQDVYIERKWLIFPTQEERIKTIPWCKHLLNTLRISAPASRSSVRVALGFDHIDEMLINSVSVRGAAYFSTQGQFFTKDVMHQPALIMIAYTRPLQEPWLIHKPWGDCLEVAEILQQIYTNISGLGIGFTDVKWTCSLI